MFVYIKHLLFNMHGMNVKVVRRPYISIWRRMDCIHLAQDGDQWGEGLARAQYSALFKILSAFSYLKKKERGKFSIAK